MATLAEVSETNPGPNFSLTFGGLHSRLRASPGIAQSWRSLRNHAIAALPDSAMATTLLSVNATGLCLDVAGHSARSGQGRNPVEAEQRVPAQPHEWVVRPKPQEDR
jgi:hypothetical protein